MAYGHQNLRRDMMFILHESAEGFGWEKNFDFSPIVPMQVATR